MTTPRSSRSSRRPARGGRAPLTLEDSLTRRSTAVRPAAGPTVRLYVCGPTVYDSAHVGHARTYLYFDVARRHLEAEGFRVRHVMNVTDVEDKIDRRAATLGISSRRLARLEERSFFRDLATLGILPPGVRPRAGDFVPQMIEVGRALERRGLLERHSSEWIYEPPARPRGENFPTGAELARHVVPEPGHRFAGAKGEERAILVWKRQERPLPSWPSPWGRGVPGWHLECFSMASRFLGVPVDLHGGARDLIYPHHFAENELSLALRGSPFSRTFLHTGFVLQDGAKMSKSTGNLVAIRAALGYVSPDELRWYLLAKPYRDRLPWDEKELARAARRYRAVRDTFVGWVEPGAGGTVGADRAEAVARKVRTRLADGLRTADALQALEDLAVEIARSGAPRAPRGDRRRVRAALTDVERRTGLALV